MSRDFRINDVGEKEIVTIAVLMDKEPADIVSIALRLLSFSVRHKVKHPGHKLAFLDEEGNVKQEILLKIP